MSLTSRISNLFSTTGSGSGSGSESGSGSSSRSESATTTTTATSPPPPSPSSYRLREKHNHIHNANVENPSISRGDEASYDTTGLPGLTISRRYRDQERDQDQSEDVGTRTRSHGYGHGHAQFASSVSVRILEEEEESRPPYLHAMLAGGTGGTCGDMLMHSLDTVKTRQQGDPHFPPKYTSMTSSYATIYRQEGLPRGLYSGAVPALMGSFPGTVIFFGVYEYTKRMMLDAGVNANVAYLSGGFFADLAASVVYVPSEVLKTRLQLQGRYNNPYFKSGYNYRSTRDAFRTIVRTEGVSALFHGYKATIFRDLPFSALQFAFYEQEQNLAKAWMGHRDIGLGLEVLTAATAGGMAGVLTCPLDVVKTRIQTQQNPPKSSGGTRKPSASRPASAEHASGGGKDTHTPRHQSHPHPPPSSSTLRSHSRPISTSSPSTSINPPGAPRLDTSSVITGLRMIYRTEGFAGWFRGVVPRGVWTSIQSSTMLVMYQYLLKKFEAWEAMEEMSPL